MGAPIGRLRILGETVAGRTPADRYLGYMFQPQSNDRLFEGVIDIIWPPRGDAKWA